MINATNPFANYTLAIAAQYNDTKAGIEEAEKNLQEKSTEALTQCLKNVFS